MKKKLKIIIIKLKKINQCIIVSKQYNYNLVQKYKNIKSMIEYHKNSLYELEQLQSESVQSYLFEDNLIDIPNKTKYHNIEIEYLEDELKEILVRKDFNEEYAISLCLEEDISKSASMSLIGEKSLDGDIDSCCVIL